MAIVSLLSNARWNAVVRAAPPRATHRRVESGTAFVAAVRRPGCIHAIVDPRLVTDIRFDVLVAHVAAANVPLLLLGNLNKRMVDACLMVEALRPTNALFADIGDTRQLRSLLYRPAAIDVSALLLHSVVPVMARLPSHVSVPTIGLFTGGAIPSRTMELSNWIGVDRRTVQRWYTRVGITGVGRVFTIARLSRSWRIMQSKRLSFERVARLVGFGSARTLSRGCQRLAGCSSAYARERSANEFADRLARALVTRAL